MLVVKKFLLKSNYTFLKLSIKTISQKKPNAPQFLILLVKLIKMQYFWYNYYMDRL